MNVDMVSQRKLVTVEELHIGYVFEQEGANIIDCSIEVTAVLSLGLLSLFVSYSTLLHLFYNHQASR